MRLTSEAFDDGRPIPRAHSDDGGNTSPPLAWEEVPAGTVEFALICDDPDAPRPEPWVHWLLYNLPGDVRELPAGLPRQAEVDRPVTATQGVNSWGPGSEGYRGPAPPRGHGTHHYHFRLYALDAPLNLGPRIVKDALLRAMEGHVLAEAEVVGTYER